LEGQPMRAPTAKACPERAKESSWAACRALRLAFSAAIFAECTSCLISSSAG